MRNPRLLLVALGLTVACETGAERLVVDDGIARLGAVGEKAADGHSMHVLRSGLDACADAARADNPTLAGWISVDLDIRDGSAEDVVVLDHGFGNPDLIECMTRTLWEASYPPDVGGATTYVMADELASVLTSM